MTPPRPKSITAPAPCVRLYLRQSLDEEAQASTATQRPLIDRSVARLRSEGVITEHMPTVVYQDIGGARYDYKRPDFLRLMGDVRPGDVVVVCWRERLGSGPRYVVAVEDIVKVNRARLFIADPHEEIRWNKTTGLVESIHGSQSDAYIEDLKLKTTKKLRELLAAGYASGDVGYGFTTQIDPSTRLVVGGVERFNKRILVDEGEAAVLVRIFEMRAAGLGWIKMAKTLTAEGLRTGSGGPWNAPTLRDLLHNRKYLGEWGMGVKKAVKEGGVRRIERGDDPIVVHLPHLRIISDELWARAHATSEARRRDMRGNLNATTHRLSGVVRCAECGGGLSIAMHNYRAGKRSHSYVCSRHRRTGACPVTMHVSAPMLEDAILGACADILGAAEDVIRRTVAEVAARQAVVKCGGAAEVAAELEAARVKLQKARRTAYGSGDDSEETVAMLRSMGERVRELEAQHARATAPADAITPALIERETLGRLADLRAALADASHPARCREMLHRLFPAGIGVRLTATTYEIEGGAAITNPPPAAEIGDSTTERQPSGVRSVVLPLRVSIPRARKAA